MANDTNASVNETIAALREEYPEAVDAIESAKYAEGCDQGYADGEKAAQEAAKAETVAALDKQASDEKDRLAALIGKYREKDASFVLDQFAAGHDLAKASEAWAEKCEQKAAEAQAKLAAATDKLIDAESGNDAGSGHQSAVEAAAPDAPAADPSEIRDPDARAKAEWEAMSADDKAKYYSDEVFVAARVRELKRDGK